MASEPSSLKGKVIIVTGGSAGIGLGIVTALARRGALVVSADRNPFTEAALEQVGAFGAGIDYVPTDIADAGSVATLFGYVESRHEQLDGLVNNAGVTIHADFLNFGIEQLETLWRTNLRSVFLCAQHAGRIMRDRGSGSIVNVASNHASSSVPGFEMYAATKGGIVSMTRAMAWSLGSHGIRVNSLSPGLTRTEALQRDIDKTAGLEQMYNAWHATGRYNAPSDVGNIAAFLLSDAAAGITGADIVADNGMSSILFNDAKRP